MTDLEKARKDFMSKFTFGDKVTCDKEDGTKVFTIYNFFKNFWVSGVEMHSYEDDWELYKEKPELTQEYLDLCDRVGEIDLNAKTYMLEEAWRLVGFGSLGFSGLSKVFPWGRTPQGGNFWFNINNKLREKPQTKFMTPCGLEIEIGKRYRRKYWSKNHWFKFEKYDELKHCKYRGIDQYFNEDCWDFSNVGWEEYKEPKTVVNKATTPTKLTCSGCLREQSTDAMGGEVHPECTMCLRYKMSDRYTEIEVES